jgi:hypothetical protein
MITAPAAAGLPSPVLPNYGRVTIVTPGGDTVHPHRLRQLVASVPEGIDADQRARLLAHVQTSDGCRVRADRVRDELRRALDGGDGAAERALDLACELDGLERVQQRVDGWLASLVEELTQVPRAVHYDDGVPA